MTIPKVMEKPQSPAITRPSDLEEVIRRRAYEIYEERGQVDGYALDDWLLAEAEVMAHQVRRRAA